MPALKILTIAAAGVAFTASAHAAGDFSFQYTFDSNDLATPAGAEKVLEELENEIHSECEFSQITSRFNFARKVTERCVADSLEQAVTDINAPHLDDAFETWKENRS